MCHPSWQKARDDKNSLIHMEVCLVIPCANKNHTAVAIILECVWSFRRGNGHLIFMDYQIKARDGDIFCNALFYVALSYQSNLPQSSHTFWKQKCNRYFRCNSDHISSNTFDNKANLLSLCWTSSTPPPFFHLKAFTQQNIRRCHPKPLLIFFVGMANTWRACS